MLEFPLLRQLRAKFRFRSFLISGVALYVLAAILSVIIAHAATVFAPNSNLASRLIMPVSSGLTFIDEHWKATLFVVALFFIPEIERLVERIEEIGGKFGNVKLGPGRKSKKPHHDADGEVN